VRKIEELGFAAGDILKIHDDSRPAGTVIAQNPAAPAMTGGERKIELLVSLGPVPRDGRIPVPDIAQRDEQGAKNLLAESGLRFGGVEYVSTQNTPGGMVMSTKPRAGTMVKQGSSVQLVVATNRAAPTPKKPEPREEPQPSGTVSPPAATVEVAETPRQIGPAGPVKPVLTPRQQELAGATGLLETPVTPGTSQATAPAPTGPASTGTAKVRYQVPPFTKPLGLKIEMVDATGTKHLLGRDVKGGEFISLDAPYVHEGVVTIYLGGEFVWQERYK
jgi:beta-lactam-binding protein with PASTA domain